MVIIVVVVIIFTCFVGVILTGAPYLPTLKPQIAKSFELAKLKPGQTLIELGCGDGRVLVSAAKAGYKSIGYEINPILAAYAWLRSWRYRSYIKVVWGNYWTKSWPEADAIYVFLLDKYMPKLDKKCIQYPYKPIKVMSFAFKIPNKPIVNQKSGVYLYEYR